MVAEPLAKRAFRTNHSSDEEISSICGGLPHQHPGKRCYRERRRIEAAFCRLKDFRRIATRYDKLARNYASAVALIAVWC